MKRLVPFGVCVVAFVLFSAAPAAAQGTGGLQFGLTGGVSIPKSETSNVYDTGWHGGLVLNYELPALPLGLRIDGDYHHFNANSLNADSGSAQLIDGNANLVLGIRILLVKVYVLGGAGVYNVRYTGFAGSTYNETDFGWNAGVGAAFVIGKVSIFVEGRYHEVTLDGGGKFKMIPLTAGIIF